MDTEQILVGLAAIAVLGVGAQWLAWRVRLPSILLLLSIGIVVGPGTGWLDPDELIGPDLLFPMVSLAVAVILFEGGLSLDLSELRQMGQVLLRLATLGMALTWVLGTLAAHFLAGLSWPVAVLLGAILTVTGPTVVGPLLRHVRPKGVVGPIAKWEGIVADVLGATLAVLVFHALAAGHASADGALGRSLWGGAETLLAGGLLGLLGSLLLALALRRHWLPDFLESPFTLAVVLGIFTLADHLRSESGLLAVTMMGVVLANQKATPVKHIIEFKENLRVLLIASLFIVLAARLSVADLERTDVGDLAFVAVLILVVRPLAVFISCWRSELSSREKLFLAWMAPRGIVAAAVSALFAQGLESSDLPDASLLAPLAFLVIIGTVAVYGLTAAPLARRLGLADSNPQGVLIAGCSRFALELAKALQQLDLAVSLVDTNRERVAAARLAGVPSTYGSALAEDAAERIPLGGIGRFFALTPNDGVNSLAALHHIDLFGRAQVYQLEPSSSQASGPPGDLRGRYLFASHADFGQLESRVAKGASVKATPITEEFDFDAFQAHHDARALPLLRLGEDGKLTVFTSDGAPSAAAGDTLISLVDAEEEQA